MFSIFFIFSSIFVRFEIIVDVRIAKISRLE
jgi:hypothetical protein